MLYNNNKAGESMEAKCKMYRILRAGCVATMVICLSICNIGIYDTHAESVEILPTIIVPEDKKQPPNDDNTSGEINAVAADPAREAASPKTKTTGSSKTMLYVGAGAVAAGALAIGLAASGGGDGGGSNDPPTTPITPSVPPVGADIAGDDWSGILLLIDGLREPITATVTQNGSQVQITTSSTQRYGQVFSGTIRPSGHMLLYDQTTGEDWTTFKGPATSTHIEMEDYVNNFTALDVLVLKR
jgi:hypothetical protein